MSLLCILGDNQMLLNVSIKRLFPAGFRILLKHVIVWLHAGGKSQRANVTTDWLLIKKANERRDERLQR